MAAIAQGGFWWAELPAPHGSEPGFRRPVVVVQRQALNASRWGSVVCVPLTSDMRWADSPVTLPFRPNETRFRKTPWPSVRMF